MSASTATTFSAPAEWLTTSEVGKLLGCGYYVALYLVRSGYISLQRDRHGRYAWSPDDVAEARRLIEARGSRWRRGRFLRQDAVAQ